MAYSVCIYCGSVKRSPFASCKQCKRSPKGSDLDMVKSLILSLKLTDDNGDSLMSKGELDQITRKIKAKEYVFNQKLVDELLKEKRLLDSSARGIQWGFLLFASFFLILPIIAVIIFIRS